MAAQGRIRRLMPLVGLALSALAGCSVRTNVDATGAAPATASHLAVTVTEVWLASAADTLPESSSGWLKQTLATPVTIDLATLTPGTLVSLASQVGTTAGTYRQLHLVLAESTGTLTSSAQGVGLLYNAQYSVTDASGAVTDRPLELPVPGAGMTLPVNLTLVGKIALGSSTGVAGTTTNTPSTTGTLGTGSTTVSAALAIDGARDLLSFAVGANTGYMLSASTRLVDESLAGAITGTLDASALPTPHPPVWVSAEEPDSTGTHHVIVARALADAAGVFTLYPLPAPKTGLAQYDVVISCAGAETVIVTGVPVSAQAVTAPAALSSTTISLAAAPTVYADVAPDNPLLPGGARVAFYQTAATVNALPYQIDGVAVDPVSHRLPGDAFGLSSGPLVAGAYSSGGSIAFTVTSPAQGNGGYITGSEGPYRTDALAAAATAVTGTLTGPSEVAVPVPGIAAGGRAGALTVTISAPPGGFDAGFLVASAGGRVVETADIASLLAAGGGIVTLSLPAGSALAASAGVPYQVAARAWNSSNPAGTYLATAGSGSVNLGDTGIAAVAIAVP